MRLLPTWKEMKAVAPTLPYDWVAPGDHRMYGAALHPDES
jgi:hypothetical protein